MRPDHSLFRELAEEFSLVRLIGKDPARAEGEGWQQWCREWRPYEEVGFKPWHNAGIACGPASGVIVVDRDDELAFKRLSRERNWNLPETRTHRTGSGKLHFLYRYPDDGHEYRCRRFRPACDLLAVGGQVVAPGSIHPDTKKPYSILKEIPISPAPQWLLAETRKQEYRPPRTEELRRWNGDVDSLPISRDMKELIHHGRPIGERSEAIMSVLNALVFANLSDSDIYSIFDTYPIGEKYREHKNPYRWLEPQIAKARAFVTLHADTNLSFKVGKYATGKFAEQFDM